MNEQELLAGLREDSIDGSVYAEVRARTMGRIRREPFSRAALAVAAALILVVGSSVLLRHKQTEVMPVRAGRDVGMVMPTVEPAVVEVPRAAKSARVRPKPQITAAAEPMEIHLMSDDPNIAIIWIAGDTL